MYALDWGIFLRHDLDSPIAPFMYLWNGEERQTRVLMTDGDPVEYAKKVLESEEKSFQRFVIGMEGYLRDEKNERTDAIIVQGFDKTQEKGTALGQMFEPKEKNGTFRKIDRVTYLGSPALHLPVETTDNPDYSVEEPGFNAMSLKDGDLTQILAFVTHGNPSVVADTVRRFLRAKLTDNTAATFSGRFDIQITPGMINHDDFLKFLVVNAADEERKSPRGTEWESKTGKKILLNINHGEKRFLTEFETENKPVGAPPAAEPKTEKKAKYAAFSESELNREYRRILSVPNARTNFTALNDIAELMTEYEKRGIAMPGKGAEKKPWWKFW